MKKYKIKTAVSSIECSEIDLFSTIEQLSGLVIETIDVKPSYRFKVGDKVRNFLKDHSSQKGPTEEVFTITELRVNFDNDFRNQYVMRSDGQDERTEWFGYDEVLEPA